MKIRIIFFLFALCAFCFCVSPVISAPSDLSSKCPALNGQLDQMKAAPGMPSKCPAFNGQMDPAKMTPPAVTSKCPALNGQLNEQQINQASKIFTNYYNTIGPIRVLIIAKKQQLDAILNSQSPDKSQIESISRELGELGGKILSARVDLHMQLQQAGITPEELGLDEVNLPPQRPNPNSPYNWGGPKQFKQRPHGEEKYFRHGFGPGYNGIPMPFHHPNMDMPPCPRPKCPAF